MAKVLHFNVNSLNLQQLLNMFNVSSTKILKNKVSCLSFMQSTGSTLIVGFFGKKQYADNAPSRLTMKLSKHLCLECSTWAMFLSSSFTVSMMALFLSSNLSDTDIMAPFMLFLSLVISCMPSTNSFSKRFLPIYPLSPTSLP